MSAEVKRVLAKRQAKIQKERRAERRCETIADVYRICSPQLDAPDHLKPYTDKLTEAVKAAFGAPPVEVTLHAPPQHGKSEAAKHALIFAAIERPALRHAYATYNDGQARTVRDAVARLAQEAGLDPHTSDGLLTLGGRTEMRFVGRGTGLTGKPVDGLLIVDDILKDRAEALSATIRETCWTWFTDVAQTRRHPGSHVIVMNTRWHLDDLPGRLVQRWKWPFIRLAAECDDADDPLGRELGEALWEARRPSVWLQQFKRSPLTWASMYQGRPRPQGDALFGPPTFYDALPQVKGYRNLYGADLAYTEKTRADWSVLAKGRLYGQDLYLVDVLRDQVQADKFTARMAAKVAAEPGPVLWFGSTTEKGVAQLIQRSVPTFLYAQATVDKYVRALPTAEQLWNVGRILVPSSDRPWKDEFLRVISEFTGEGDGQDDDVDALAALGHLVLAGAGSMGVRSFNEALRDRMRGHLRAV